MLILDEPTSGVDPVARDEFWALLIDLSRQQGVTIFISTHFMNEGERCDRISLMHAGQVLASDTPAGLMRGRGAANLEEAFISYLEEATGVEKLHRHFRKAHTCGARSTPKNRQKCRRSTCNRPDNSPQCQVRAPSARAACSATPTAKRWNSAATRSA